MAPYAIVGGNPAKVIKYRFPEKIRNKLARLDLDRFFEKTRKQQCFRNLHTTLTEDNIDEIIR